MVVHFNSKMRRVDPQVALAADIISNPDRNTIAVAPTGMGKTEIGLTVAAAKKNADENHRTMVICPNQRLVGQWLSRTEKYGLNSKLSVFVNPTTESIMGHWETGGAYAVDEFGRIRDWQYAARRERGIKRDIGAWKRGKFDEKKAGAWNADLMITTYQLIKMDLEKGRIDPESLKGFGAIIIDEVPDSVAYDPTAMSERDNPEEDVSRRISRYYEKLMELKNERTQIVGLTAFPGKKASALERLLKAKTIKPAMSLVEPFLPKFTPTELPVEDELVRRIDDGLLETLTIRKSQLARTATIEFQKPYGLGDISIGIVSHWAGDDAHADLQRAARGFLKLYHTRNRLLESPTYIFGEEQKNPETGKVLIDPETRKALTVLDYVSRNSDVNKEEIEKELKERQGKRKNLGKIDEILEVLTQMKQPTVAATNYVDSTLELDFLVRKMPGVQIQSGYLVGGAVQTREQQEEVIEKFNKLNGGLDLLITDYKAGGHGLDLFRGEAVIYAGLPPSVEMYMQMRGRVTRSSVFGEPKYLNEYLPYYEGTSEADAVRALVDVRFEDLPGAEVGLIGLPENLEVVYAS